MLEQFLELQPYSLIKEEKRERYARGLSELTRYHYQRCEPYRKIIDMFGHTPESVVPVEALPFLPVRLFKELDLMSIDPEKVFKLVRSSGTSGQAPSKVSLDQETAGNQTKVLSKIVSSFLGPARLPMLIIESPSVIKDRGKLSARAAGVIGYSVFGTDVTYALDDEMNPDFEKIDNFCKRHHGKKVLLFGFTFVVWTNFIQKLKSLGRTLPITDGILIHGGGWKRMQEQAVDPKTFNEAIKQVCGVSRVHNYYGMIEQTGSVCLECEQGHLHCSIFSDIVIRNSNLSVCKFGVRGLIQLLSPIPKSYPGHSILTEDVGEIIGEDDCACGRLGKYFRVHGRAERAELRGCSDVH